MTFIRKKKQINEKKKYFPTSIPAPIFFFFTRFILFGFYHKLVNIIRISEIKGLKKLLIN